MLKVLGSRPSFVLLPIIAVSYNGILAFLATFGFPVSFGTAALAEIMILSTVLVLVASGGFYDKDKVFLVSMLAFVATTLYLTVLNGTFLITGFRNFLILFSFALLGMRLSFQEVNKVFVACTVIVLVVLVIELAHLELYVKIFEPANYFFKTRGNELKEFNEVGVFGNALSFESRFTYGIFDGPRTSSIFLEQVSLANFATILCIYLLAFIKLISKKQSFTMLLTIFLIVTSSNARTTSILTIILFVAYFVVPLVPRFLNALVAIAILSIALTIYFLYPNATGDNLKGRTKLSMEHFLNLELSDYLGLGANNLNDLWDAGYAYIIACNSIFGATIVLYLVLFSIKQRYAFSKKVAYGFTLYFFVNMIIGGNTVYSMKVATLQWLLVGFIIALESHQLKRLDNLDLALK